MKKVLIINGHPYNKSLCNALADSYEKGAREAGVEVNRINLYDLKFDPILHCGYHVIQELEPDLKKSQDLITWAEHLVFVFPTWWLDMPALMKGFFDRIFLPGFAFKYDASRLFPVKLLKGKSARLLVTSDSPRWFSFLVYGYGMHNSFHRGTLGFCGIGPAKHTFFDRVKDRNENEIKKWLAQVEEMGRKIK